MAGFYNLYSEAVCKLHIFCVRMNIISGSLANGGGGGGGGIVCIGKKVIRVHS